MRKGKALVSPHSKVPLRQNDDPFELEPLDQVRISRSQELVLWRRG